MNFIDVLIYNNLILFTMSFAIIKKIFHQTHINKIKN